MERSAGDREASLRDAKGLASLTLSGTAPSDCFDTYAVLSAPDVRLGPAVFLPGDVFAKTFSKNPTAVILCSVFPGSEANLAWPAFPEFSVSLNSPSLTVPAGDEAEAGPGDYEEIVVRPDATLVLTGGTYEIRSLRVEAGATVMCAEASRMCENQGCRVRSTRQRC